ncbi:MAG: hypothetical protein ABIA47_02980 [bacterium]
MNKYTALLAVFVLFLMGAGCASTDDAITDSLTGFEDFDLTLELDDYTVDIVAPELVSVGDSVKIVATITNSGSEDAILDSVDIASEYLEGVAVTSADPAYFETYLVETDNTISHTFLETIPAGESLEVTFSATAVEAGLYSGAFDICINTGWNCFFEDIATMVQ